MNHQENLDEHPVLSVSAAICTFNSERFLPMELESIARQTRLLDEVVVCDDASTDKTLEILEEWSRAVPFPVRIFRNPENLGYTKNFERAVSLCSGEIILLADHDDIWMPNRVETILRRFAESPTLGLVSSNARTIDADGVDQGMELSEFVEWMRLRDFWSLFFPDDREMVLWTGCTMALRRRFLPYVLPIPEHLACHDIWFYLTYALISEIQFIPECLVQYRLHGKNHSTAPRVSYLRENPSRWRYFNSFMETLDSQHPQLLESLENFVRAQLLRSADSEGISGSASASPADFPVDFPVEFPADLPANLSVDFASKSYEFLDAETVCRLERFLKMLNRRKRHFQARRDAPKCPWLWFREMVNGGYLTHPQPFLSMLYDFREILRGAKGKSGRSGD